MILTDIGKEQPFPLKTNRVFLSMAFPVSYQGQTSLSHTNMVVEETVQNICIGLKNNNSSNVKATGSSIKFDGNLFGSLSNWNVVAMVSNGKINIAKNDGTINIKYHINFIYSFFLSIVLIFLVSVLIFLSSVITEDNRLLGNIYYMPIVWVVVFGANYLITILRVPYFLQKIAKSPQK